MWQFLQKLKDFFWPPKETNSNLSDTALNKKIQKAIKRNTLHTLENLHTQYTDRFISHVNQIHALHKAIEHFHNNTESGDTDNTKEWSCLRPSTPDGSPILEKSSYKTSS